MIDQSVRQTVVCRVRLRENLKPVHPYWRFSDSPEPDWLVITQVVGPRNYEAFDLQLLNATNLPSAAVHLAGYNSYETLRIAAAQAHADIGVEYVEWEPCNIELTNEDGSVGWQRALPVPA